MSKIKVYVRVRPPLPGEFDQPGVFNCVEMEEESGNWINIKKDGENTRYFARCWGARSSQEEVYRVVGVPTVNDVFEGYFGTIFVYGQTGTGKTFTLGCSTPSLEGVQPRAIQHMFDKKEKEAHKYDVEIKMQYVQLYRDSIQDLLNITKDNLMLRVDDTGATIEQVTTRTIQNYEEGMNLVKEGDGNRVVANTKMNSASSRSHACLITYIRRKNKETGETTEGRLYLIDLAGSERVSKSGVTGDAYQEAVAINKSLTTLGNCVAGIVNGEKVVAFRDSKLTRLLQHSLSGHGRTSIIVTIRPDSPNMQETLCTLKFGERAQKVEAQMTPAGFRDQVLDKMLQVGDIQAASADAAAKSRAYQILAVKLDQDCVTKEAELKEAEEEARQRIAEATSELISLQKECDAKVASESEAAQNQAKEELEALRKSNASVMKEIEDRVSAAVSKATKELTTLQAERKEKIRSLTEKVELLREKTSKLKPISANMSEQEIVSQKTAEINEKIEQIQKQIKSCRTSPHENLSLDELELKRETLIDLLYRLEEHHSKLQDGMQGWDMKVIEKKKHMPTDEEVEMYMLAMDNNKDDEDAKADSDSSAPPPSDSSDDSDTDDSSDDSSNSSSSGDKKEKDDKGDQTVERKQFDITCQKERGLQDLVDQVTTYLEYGTTVYRLTDRGIQPQYIYLNPNRTSLFITKVIVAGEERGEPLEMLPLDAVQNIVNGQSTPRFMKMRGNRRPVGRDFAVPATSEQVDDSNIEEYVYRSFSLFTKAENHIDLVCNTDTDYEGWTVLLHRLTHISPTWAQPMDLEGLPQEGLLNEKEREMCAMAHITPECYFRTREATLIVEQQMFLTLVDVRTASGMDLIHSQKMFEFFTKQGWIERQVVHQQKYRDQYLEVQLQKNEQERRRLEEATSRQADQQRKDRLRGMFKKYRIKPEDGVLEDLLIAYSGNEDKIIQQLVKKYGPEPDPGELVLLIRPPKAERTEQRQLFSAIVTLAMCSDPPRPIPRIQDMTPAMLIDFRKTSWDQGAEDPVVVELTNMETNQGTYYYLLSDNREVIVASLREITSSCLTKAILSIPELTVSNKIDPMLTIMTNDLNESTKAQQLLETITEYVRNAMTRCSQDVVNVMASSPNFLGKLKIDISNPRKPVLPNLLLRSCWYADKIQGMIEDSLKDEYDMIFVMLSAMRKQLIEKRPSLTLCDPPSAIDFLHNVILPWLEAAYTKAQDEFCECVPSDVSQRVSELLEGKHFVGGTRLKPNEHPPKVQKDSIDDVCSPRTTKK